MAIQILKNLKALHSLGYVHCDLKLENICMKFKTTSNEIFFDNNNLSSNLEIDQAKFYLIDFGLSSPYLLRKRQVKTNFFRGNLLFASHSQCLLNELCPYDDIESLLYIIVYLLSNYSLPWI